MKPEPTVFVVDDEEGIRQLLCSVAELAQLNIEVYASAEDFLSAYTPERPGCLVLDIQMPGMNGLDLQERLVDWRIQLPVIMISGQEDGPMVVRAMRAGALDFLGKPVSIHTLLQRMRRAIDWDEHNRGLVKSMVKEEILDPKPNSPVSSRNHRL